MDVYRGFLRVSINSDFRCSVIVTNEVKLKPGFLFSCLFIISSTWSIVMVQAFLWSFLTSFDWYERGGLNNLMKSLYWLVKFIIIETLWSSPKMQINLKQHKSLTGFVFKNLSSHVRESKTALDFGFQVMDSAFQVLDSSCQWNFDSGFQSLVWFRIYLAIFRIPQIKIFRIPESVFEVWRGS